MSLSPYLQSALTGLSVALDKESDAALRFLNARIPHRYSAIYHLENGLMRAIYLHDKQNELVPEYLATVPLEGSLCHLVIKDGVFRTDNSTHDHRLDGNRFQGVIGSYCGLPLLDKHSELFGTLCHFDLDNYILSDEEFEFMQHAARMLPKFLQRHRAQWHHPPATTTPRPVPALRS